MTAEEITKLIDIELKAEKDLTNVFGLDLTKCIVVPTRQKYIHALDNTKSEQLWTVLEDSEDKSGYKIFYDEDENMFGLGIYSKTNELINIGYYGTFLETLYSM
jgi:hypothetical protein